jgi:hypothetical protein
MIGSRLRQRLQGERFLRRSGISSSRRHCRTSRRRRPQGQRQRLILALRDIRRNLVRADPFFRCGDRIQAGRQADHQELAFGVGLGISRQRHELRDEGDNRVGDRLAGRVNDSAANERLRER